MTDALDALEPSGSSIKYRGEVLSIRPLTVGQLPRLVRTARPAINAVLALQDLPDDPAVDGFVDLLVSLVADHGESVYQAVAICIDRPVEWVAGGELDEFVALSKLLVEVNRDFFVQRLGPLLGRRADTPTAGGGPTPPSS